MHTKIYLKLYLKISNKPKTSSKEIMVIENIVTKLNESTPLSKIMFKKALNRKTFPKAANDKIIPKRIDNNSVYLFWKKYLVVL
jgi:hypothetical protein